VTEDSEEPRGRYLTHYTPEAKTGTAKRNQPISVQLDYSTG